MKIFTNKNLIQKLIIAIVMVTLLNFCIAPVQVNATVGGLLANGIRDLALILPDALISVAQLAVTGTWIDAVERETNSEHDNNEFWCDSVHYPIIQLSPELIFADEVELLSIDFISSEQEKKDYIIPANGTTNLGSSDEGAQNTGNAISLLRKIIAIWYVVLRNLAIVGLLSVLVYIGIRIIISSSSGDKAKYKERLMDWVVAFCLLFFMHFIMAGIVTVVNKLDMALSSGLNIATGIPLNEEYGNVKYNNTIDYLKANSKVDNSVQEIARAWFANRGYTIVDLKDEILTPQSTGAVGKKKWTFTLKKEDEYRVEIEGPPKGVSGKLVNSDNIEYIVSNADLGNGAIFYKDLSQEEIQNLQNTINLKVQEYDEDDHIQIVRKDTGINLPSSRIEAKLTTNSEGQNILVSNDAEGTGTNILYYINYARLYCNANSEHNPEGFGFTMLYTILVVMTVMFLFRYMKRVIYVAFLTMIAPLVALTYPLDKIKDGKAQAFNMWIREYIFNVLIQPFHLLIYGILVGGAMALASAYWIYGVVCMAFLIPAEKLLRKFFGFDQAGTLSAAGSFAGGALFSTMLSKINRPKSKGRSEGEDKGKNGIKFNRSPNSSGGLDVNSTIAAARGGSGNVGGEESAARRTARVSTRNQTGRNNVRPARDSNPRVADRIAQAQEAARARTVLANTPTHTPSSTSSSSKSKPTRWNRLSKFKPSDIASAVGGYYKEKAIKGVKGLPKKFDSAARRAVVGGLAGGALALTGAAVGAASGDPGNAMKLATAGAAAGYYGANYYGDKEAKNIEELNGVIDEAFWNEDNKARQQYLADEAFKHDEESIRMLSQFTGSMQEAREVIDSDFAQQMLDEGIADPKLMGRAYKLKHEIMKPRDNDARHMGIDDENEASKVAIAYALLAKRAPDKVTQSGSQANKIYLADRTKRWQKEGMNKELAKQTAENDIRIIGYINDGIY